MFFQWRRLRPGVGQHGPLERILRMAALTGVVILVAWGFWANMERRMDTLGVRGQIRDSAEQLSSGERQALEGIAKRFQRRFDLELEVRVLTAPFRPDSWQGKSILLAVNPEARQVVFTAPPLVRRAMGEAFMAEVAESFAPAFTPGPDIAGMEGGVQESWQAGMFAALALVEQKLAELTR